MSRRAILLTEAARALERAIDPLHHSFLVEHSVSLDEAGDLADDLALGARMLLHSRREMRRGGWRADLGASRVIDGIVAGIDDTEADHG